VKRGDIVTVAARSEFAGKPRPAVIVQDENVEGMLSEVVCPFTTDDVSATLIRLAVQPSEENGLRSLSWIMVDKIGAVRRAKIGKRIGQLAAEDMIRLNRALIVFLGLDR
jgi:mRNA interferase MazF